MNKTARLDIIRTHEGIEYNLVVELSRDPAGDLLAINTAGILEKYWSTACQLEIVETGYLIYSAGNEIELTDEETIEAEGLLTTPV